MVQDLQFVTCDAPFGYSPLQSCGTRLSSGNSFTIYNDSDETGALIPQLVEIEILTGGDFRLSNSLDPLLMVNYLGLSGDTVIRGCKKGETIATNLPSHDIANSFNYVYPRLINLDEVYPGGLGTAKSISSLRKNVFTLSGCSAAINMAYRTIRLAMA